MLMTFEFPDNGKAQAFASALAREGRARCVTHRVVDVEAPTDSDAVVATVARDYLIAVARKFGAVDGPRPYDLTRDEREHVADLLAELYEAKAEPAKPYMLPLDGTDVSALRKVLSRALV